jgi:hypothetical protein
MGSPATGGLASSPAASPASGLLRVSLTHSREEVNSAILDLPRQLVAPAPFDDGGSEGKGGSKSVKAGQTIFQARTLGTAFRNNHNMLCVSWQNTQQLVVGPCGTCYGGQTIRNPQSAIRNSS